MIQGWDFWGYNKSILVKYSLMTHLLCVFVCCSWSVDCNLNQFPFNNTTTSTLSSLYLCISIVNSPYALLSFFYSLVKWSGKADIFTWFLIFLIFVKSRRFKLMISILNLIYCNWWFSILNNQFISKINKNQNLWFLWLLILQVRKKPWVNSECRQCHLFSQLSKSLLRIFWS